MRTALLTMFLALPSLGFSASGPDFEKTLLSVEATLKSVKDAQGHTLLDHLHKTLQTLVRKNAWDGLSPSEQFGKTLDAMGEFGPELFVAMNRFVKDRPNDKIKVEMALRELTSRSLGQYSRAKTLTHEELGFGGRHFLVSVLGTVFHAKAVGAEQAVRDEWCPWCSYALIAERETPPAEAHKPRTATPSH